MNVKEIKEIAANIGINPGKMKKADLIRTIQSTEGNNPCFQSGRDNCDQTGCSWWNDCQKNN